MGAHAKLSPSSAKIWMSCPGMVRLAAGIEDKGSIFAAEGTAAHTLAEQCLLHEDGSLNARARTHVGDTVEDFEVTEEMADAVQVYLDYIGENTIRGDEIKIEERLRYNDDIWGTADYVRYRPKTQELLVADYKHGSGVYVDVFENPQAMTYALMAAKALGNRGVSIITLAIIQPRCGTQAVREWHIGPAELLDWEEQIIAAHNAVLEKDAKLVPGDHCKWCKAAAICPALHDLANEAAKNDFSVVEHGDDGDAEVLQAGKLAEKLADLPALEKYIKAVREAAYKTAIHGTEIPGHKLVKKQPRRKWRSESETIEALQDYGLERDDILTNKIKSPSQIEKVIGTSNKSDIEDLWVKESSGVTLVGDDDRRPAIIPGDATEDFEPIDRTEKE